MKSHMIVVVLSVIFVGCASGASQQAQAPQKRSNLPVEDTERRTPDATGFACDADSGATGFGLFDEGRHRLNGKKIFVRDADGDRVSLCDVINRTGKDAVFFQFAGVTCTECWDKGKYFQEVINSSQYRNIQWIVVITDFLNEEFDEEDYREYMERYGRGAIRVHDEAKLWKALSEDPTIPTRATTFAMNRDNDVIVYNRSGTKEDKILDAAVRLAEEVRD